MKGTTVINPKNMPTLQNLFDAALKMYDQVRPADEAVIGFNNLIRHLVESPAWDNRCKKNMRPVNTDEGTRMARITNVYRNDSKGVLTITRIVRGDGTEYMDIMLGMASSNRPFLTFQPNSALDWENVIGVLSLLESTYFNADEKLPEDDNEDDDQADNTEPDEEEEEAGLILGALMAGEALDMLFSASSCQCGKTHL